MYQARHREAGQLQSARGKPQLHKAATPDGSPRPAAVVADTAGSDATSTCSISQILLEWIFHAPHPPARTVIGYLDIEDIINLRNTCKLHRSYIRNGGKWEWMLHRISVPLRESPYLTANLQLKKLLLGVPPRARDGYRTGRPIVVLDVATRDRARDVLNLGSIFSNLGAWEYVTLLVLDGTTIDAGDVGHLLKSFQNVTALSLRHCWNVDLQLLYQLFKKTPKEHTDQVNFYNHVAQRRVPSKCPAEQIKRLWIWDIDGLQPLMTEMTGNGHRLVSQIGVQLFIRNFDVDVRRCENQAPGYGVRHSVFMVCVGQAIQCHDCNKHTWIEACPKCRLQSSCEICGEDYYQCAQCARNSVAADSIKSPQAELYDLELYSTDVLATSSCRAPQCKWHDNKHYYHSDCLVRKYEICLRCPRYICALERAVLEKSFSCEVCKKYTCGCEKLQSCRLCHGYMCGYCIASHGSGCQWRKG